ncbi:hypothetical protein T4A_5803, partial [Trichinella pseudospiralis]
MLRVASPINGLFAFCPKSQCSGCFFPIFDSMRKRWVIPFQILVDHIGTIRKTWSASQTHIHTEERCNLMPNQL